MIVLNTPVLYLVAALVGAWFTKQALWPVQLPKLRAVPSFFAGWLTNELALHHLAWQVVATGIFIWQGALRAWPGWVALALTIVQWAGLAVIIARIRRSRDAVADGLTEALGPDLADLERGELARRVRRRWLILPLARHPAVESTWHQPWAEVDGHELKLDLHVPKERSDRPAPVLLYVHGGAWILGYRERQGLPLLLELAGRGWVGVNADYRLSPKASLPDHLIDVKRAIAWIREHADELGADPDFIALAGGSAGGHLAALAALTANDPRYQPGFEDADTSVQACVPIYGVYDLLFRGVERGRVEHVAFLERYVVQRRVDEDLDAWLDVSPLYRVNADAPPFLIVHGEYDSIAPTSGARAFAQRLRDVSHNPVAYVELPGAQHAFDVFPSLRTSYLLDGVVRFLDNARGAGDGRAADDPREATDGPDTQLVSRGGRGQGPRPGRVGEMQEV